MERGCNNKNLIALHLIQIYLIVMVISPILNVTLMMTVNVMAVPVPILKSSVMMTAEYAMALAQVIKIIMEL